jgi:hypothetical protein
MNIFLLTALLMSIQLNTQPKIIFNKDFESENSFIIHQAIQTSDDGLVLLLSSMQKNYIIKFSADIDSLWTNFISDDRKANYNLISETSEGELLLLGSRIQPYDSSQSSIFTASSLRISTPESRKQQAVFALMSPDGDLILETFIGEAKYGSPCALILVGGFCFMIQARRFIMT